MSTQINQNELELVNAMIVIKKYQEKELLGIKNFNEDVWGLIELLIKTATEQHSCPKCGTKLKLYVLTNI